MSYYNVHQVFLAQREMGCGWSSFFPDVPNVDPFRRYSRSKSKVVRNRAEIWTFFGPPKFFLGGPSKSCTPCGTSFGVVSWPSAAISDFIEPNAIRSAYPENPNLEPNMEWIGCTVCGLFALKLYCDLEAGVRGHSRSSKAALFDRAHTTL